MKILTVDDELVSRIKLKTLLSTYYGECDEASDGETALTIIEDAYRKSEPYELVTVDFEMPGMNGAEVVKKIRQLENKNKVKDSNKTKILLVTKRTDTNNVSNSFYKGCESYIHKPVKPENLHAAMKIIDCQQKQT